MSCYLGLDVGGTNLSAGVVDSENKVISHARLPSGAGRSMEEIIRDMARVIDMAAREAGMDSRDFPYIGVGVPSNINPKTGLLVHANCFGWHNVDFRGMMEDSTGCSVEIENDANCAVLGEMLAGSAKGCKNVVMLTLGTGVGCGILLNGTLFCGADGTGAEFGHTKLVYNGRLCTCGQRGCLEAYCSATGLVTEAKQWMPEEKDLQARTVFSRMQMGHPGAKYAWDHYLGYLSCAIGNAIALFRPDVIVLGGGVANAGDVLLAPLREKVFENTFSAKEIGIPPILKTTLGDDAGIIGAAKIRECRTWKEKEERK